MIRSIIPWLLIGLFAACEEPDIVSSEVIPGTDQPGVIFSDTTSLVISTVREDSLVGSNATLPLFLGSLNDQLLGTSAASVYIQMRLSSVPFTGFDRFTTPDSVVLTLGYSGHFGDSTAVHNISVYRMNESMTTDSVYYTTRDFALSDSLGSASLIPNIEDSVEVDSVMLPPHIRIRLNNSFGETLMNEYISNSNLSYGSHAGFLDFFKGLYIKDIVDYTGGGDVRGSMLLFDPGSAYNTVTVYYNGTSKAFTLNASSARNVRFEHAYNSGIFTDQLQFYVQSMAGLKTKIQMPDINEYIENEAISVNKAEIVVSLKSGTTTVIPNHSSMIVFAADSAGRNTLITDFFESANYVGGIFDGTNYKFNVSRHVQRILNGEVGNYGFYLVGGGSVSNANRTVLNGAGSVKLNLTYTIQNN